MAFSSVFQSFRYNFLELICDSQRYRHDARQQARLFLHLGALLCAAERLNRAAARQPIQLSQHSTTGSKVAGFPDGKKPLAHFVCRINLKINAATAEHVRVWIVCEIGVLILLAIAKLSYKLSNCVDAGRNISRGGVEIFIASTK